MYYTTWNQTETARVKRRSVNWVRSANRMTFDGWAATEGAISGLRSRPVPSSLYQM